MLPSLTRPMLEALRKGLEADDPLILQGATTSPPPLRGVLDWPLEGADPLVYAAWKSGAFETVGPAEEWFARLCFDCDQRLDEPAGCRWFLNWADEEKRDTMRAMMLGELALALDAVPAREGV